MKKNKVILICTECYSRNYNMQKPESSVEKLELKKHCKQCNKHTKHKETR